MQKTKNVRISRAPHTPNALVSDWNPSLKVEKKETTTNVRKKEHFQKMLE